jgi:hypothetical protein
MVLSIHDWSNCGSEAIAPQTAQLPQDITEKYFIYLSCECLLAHLHHATFPWGFMQQLSPMGAPYATHNRLHACRRTRESRRL